MIGRLLTLLGFRDDEELEVERPVRVDRNSDPFWWRHGREHPDDVVEGVEDEQTEPTGID